MPRIWTLSVSGLLFYACCTTLRPAIAQQNLETDTTAVQNSSEHESGFSVVLRGQDDTELAPHGLGNIYAPELAHDGQRWLMWYGGQGKDGHDRIHLAQLSDAGHWERLGVAIDNGKSNHVNDPSVVRAQGYWWMFYTVADVAEEDSIAAARSTDGLQWEVLGVVLQPGPGNSWDSGKVGRPSVLFEHGKFRLWYDAQPSSTASQSGDQLASQVAERGRAVGYAESQDGIHWERLEKPVFQNGAGAVHVSRAASIYLMVYESRKGTLWATSSDGLAWKQQGLLHGLSGLKDDQYGQVTPFLLLSENARQLAPESPAPQPVQPNTTSKDKARRTNLYCYGSDEPSTPVSAKLYFGAASRTTWDGNSIAAVEVNLDYRGLFSPQR